METLRSSANSSPFLPPTSRASPDDGGRQGGNAGDLIGFSPGHRSPYLSARGKNLTRRQHSGGVRERPGGRSMRRRHPERALQVNDELEKDRRMRFASGSMLATSC